MPRRPRIDEAGMHHVLNRGVARQEVFLEAADYESFLKLMCEAAALHGCTIHSYCVMRNHYHLLVETKQNNLSKFMRALNAGYAIYFNKKYRRSGHLWQGRFKSWYVTDEGYLYTLIKYIEFNPVKAGIVKKPEAYRYSTIRSFFGLSEPLSCVRGSMVFRDFGPVSERRELFASWYDEAELAAFRKSAMAAAAPERNPPDDAELLKTLFASVSDKKTRNEAIAMAYASGVSQHRIAAFLDISQPTIAYVIRKQRLAKGG